MYREQWVADIMGDRSVLSVALDVHMTTTGSLERHPEEQHKDIRVLQEVVRTWKNHGICDFDDAVLAVIKAALKALEEPGKCGVVGVDGSVSDRDERRKRHIELGRELGMKVEFATIRKEKKKQE